MDITNLPKPDVSKMIWVFVSEDTKVVIPFQGSEQEAFMIQTADRNPYTPLL